MQYWLRLWTGAIMLVAALTACGEVDLPGNGRIVCGHDQDGGHCPAGMTCCSGYCFTPAFLSACYNDAARGDVADVVASDEPDSAMLDGGSDATNDTQDAVTLDAIDAGNIGTDVADASDVIDVNLDVGTDVPTDVGMDTPPSDVSRDVGVDVIDVPVVDVPVDAGPPDVPCPSGQTRCSGTCVDLTTNASNCGLCGFVCMGGMVCVSHACQCPSGQTNCSGTCANLQTSATNCGTCGMACGSGRVCSGAACVSSTGRLQVNADRVAGYETVGLGRTFASVRMDSASASYGHTALVVGAFRYVDGTFGPSVRISRVAMRFEQPVVPTGTRIVGVSIQLRATNLADNPPQNLVVTPFLPPPPPAPDWTASYWPLMFWGVTIGGGSPDSPILYSTQTSISLFQSGSTPTTHAIALTPSAVSALVAAGGPYWTMGLMEVHDAYGSPLDPLPLDGTHYANITFDPALESTVLLVDYAP